MRSVAKYDWKQLEKEFILSEYKSKSAFLKSKGIKATGNTNKQTKGWNDKKAKKEQKKGKKIVEKVIEKEAEKEAQKIVNVKDMANELLQKIAQANDELNMHLARNKKKTKTVEYDYECNKPKKETIEEQEEIKSYVDIIDRKGLKELTSALKDLNDILSDKNEDDNITESLADSIQKAYENRVGDE